MCKENEVLNSSSIKKTIMNVDGETLTDLIKRFEHTQIYYATNIYNSAVAKVINKRILLPINKKGLKVCQNCGHIQTEVAENLVCEKCGYKHYTVECNNTIEAFNKSKGLVKNSCNPNFYYLLDPMVHRYKHKMFDAINAINSWVFGNYKVDKLLDYNYCKALFDIRFKLTGLKWCPYEYAQNSYNLLSDRIEENKNWFELTYDKTCSKWYLLRGTHKFEFKDNPYLNTVPFNELNEVETDGSKLPSFITGE